MVKDISHVYPHPHTHTHRHNHISQKGNEEIRRGAFVLSQIHNRKPNSIRHASKCVFILFCFPLVVYALFAVCVCVSVFRPTWKWNECATLKLTFLQWPLDSTTNFLNKFIYLLFQANEYICFFIPYYTGIFMIILLLEILCLLVEWRIRGKKHRHHTHTHTHTRGCTLNHTAHYSKCIQAKNCDI